MKRTILILLIFSLCIVVVNASQYDWLTPFVGQDKTGITDDGYMSGITFMNNNKVYKSIDQYTTCNSSTFGSIGQPLVDDGGVIWATTSNTIRILNKSCAVVASAAHGITWGAEAVLADIDNNGRKDYCTFSSNTIYCWEFNGSAIVSKTSQNVGGTFLVSSIAPSNFNYGSVTGASGKYLYWTILGTTGGATVGRIDLGVLYYNGTAYTYKTLKTDFAKWQANANNPADSKRCGSSSTGQKETMVDTVNPVNDQPELWYVNLYYSGASTIVPKIYKYNLSNATSLVYTGSKSITTDCSLINGSFLKSLGSPVQMDDLSTEGYSYYDPFTGIKVNNGFATYFNLSTDYTSPNSVIVRNVVGSFSSNAELCELTGTSLICYDSVGSTVSSCSLSSISAGSHPFYYYYSTLSDSTGKHALALSDGLYDFNCNKIYSFGLGGANTGRFISADVDGDTKLDLVFTNVSYFQIYRSAYSTSINQSLPTITNVDPEAISVQITGNGYSSPVQVVGTCSDAEGDSCLWQISCDGTPDKIGASYLTGDTVSCVYANPGTYTVELWVTDSYHIPNSWNRNTTTITVTPFNTTGGGLSCGVTDSLSFTDAYSLHGWTFNSGPIPSTPVLGYLPLGPLTRNPTKSFTCVNNVINASFKLRILESGDYTQSYVTLGGSIITGLSHFGGVVYLYDGSTNPNISTYVNNTWERWDLIVYFLNSTVDVYKDGVYQASGSIMSGQYQHANSLEWFSYSGVGTFDIDDVVINALGNAVTVQNASTYLKPVYNNTGMTEWAGFYVNKSQRPMNYQSQTFNWTACDVKNYTRNGWCPVRLMRDQILGDTVNYTLQNMVYVVIFLAVLIVFALVVTNVRGR